MGHSWACRNWCPTTSSGSSTRTRPNTACPTTGPPRCGASTSRSRPAGPSRAWSGAAGPPSSCWCTAGRRTPTPGTPWPWPSDGPCWPSTCRGTATPTAGPTAPFRPPATGATWRPSSASSRPRPAAWSACRSAASPPWRWPPPHPSSCARWCWSTSRRASTPRRRRPSPTSSTGRPASTASTICWPGPSSTTPAGRESSLRRGILHNAVQREDGSWVWRYARFRTDASGPAAHPDFGDLWDAVSGLTMPLLLVRGLAWSVVDDADVAELLRRQPTRHGRRRGGGRPQRPGRPAARAGRHPHRLPLRRRLMDDGA